MPAGYSLSRLGSTSLEAMSQSECMVYQIQGAMFECRLCGSNLSGLHVSGSDEVTAGKPTLSKYSCGQWQKQTCTRCRRSSFYLLGVLVCVLVYRLFCPFSRSLFRVVTRVRITKHYRAPATICSRRKLSLFFRRRLTFNI